MTQEKAQTTWEDQKRLQGGETPCRWRLLKNQWKRTKRAHQVEEKAYC